MVDWVFTKRVVLGCLLVAPSSVFTEGLVRGKLVVGWVLFEAVASRGPVLRCGGRLLGSGRGSSRLLGGGGCLGLLLRSSDGLGLDVVFVVGEVLAGVAIVVVHLEDEVGDDGDEIGVAGALAVAVDGALDVGGPGPHRREGVGHGEVGRASCRERVCLYV